MLNKKWKDDLRIITSGPNWDCASQCIKIIRILRLGWKFLYCLWLIDFITHLKQKLAEPPTLGWLPLPRVGSPYVKLLTIGLLSAILRSYSVMFVRTEKQREGEIYSERVSHRCGIVDVKAGFTLFGLPLASSHFTLSQRPVRRPCGHFHRANAELIMQKAIPLGKPRSSFVKSNSRSACLRRAGAGLNLQVV